jgi:hypothetical protein
MKDGLKSCRGKRRQGILALLVIVSISLAVLATLAALLPAVSADTDGIVTTNASVNPGEIRIGNLTTVTLTVSATEEVPVDVTYMFPEGVEYAGNATPVPTNITAGNALIWNGVELAPGAPWSVSFDLDPTGMVDSIPAYNIPLNVLNVVPYSGVTYGTTAGKPLRVTGGGNNDSGTWTFGFVVMDRPEETFGNLVFQDHTAIDITVKAESIDTLTALETSAFFSGTATVNGTSGYNFTVNVEDNDESGDTFEISVTGPGLDYTAKGTVQGNIKISGASEFVPFPALFVNVTAPETLDMDILAPDGLYIGQPVGITGYALLNNTGNATEIIVKLYVDGFLLRQDVRQVPHTDAKYVNVSTTWIPMSSEMHTISMRVYVLRYDGTELWIEAQGPNEATMSKTIYVKRVS